MKKDKLYTSRGNLFVLGGMPEGYQLVSNPNLLYTETLKDAQKRIGAVKAPGYTLPKKTNWGEIANVASSVIAPGLTGLISDGYSTGGVGEGIATVGNAAGDIVGAIPGVGTLAAPIVKGVSAVFGGIYNRFKGIKENKENIAALDANTAQAKAAGNALASSTSTNELLDNAGQMVSSLGFTWKDLYKNGWATDEGTKKGNKKLGVNDSALRFQSHGLMTGADTVDQINDDAVMSNFKAAYGGFLPMISPTAQPTGAVGIMQQDKYLSAINNRTSALANKTNTNTPSSFSALGNRFADGGGIHIKPSHRGIFTEKANRAGMGVQEYASHVLANKEDYPTSTIRQANFARNAKGWKHAGGGSLEAAFLDNFSNNPIGAVMEYNRGLEARAAQREAEQEAAAQQAAYDDMQKRLIAAETQAQGLQSIVNNQNLSIQSLMDAQLQNNYADDWRERMGQAADDVVANSSSIVSNAADKNKNWQYIKKRLKASGKFNDTQIEGIKLNLQRESGFNWQDRSGDNGSAWGLAQWHKPRRPKDMSFDGQINHLIDTLYNYDGTDHWIGKDNYKGFMNARTPEEAHYYIAKGWERPTDSILKGLKVASDKSLKTHAFGGELGTNGTDFTNGLLEINVGDSHENNPHEGVQLGFDPNGVPNLVEEGETVFNDYVYSKRMMVPEFMKNQLGISGKKDEEVSFADASKKIAEASKERPNNPMDQEYLKDALGKLAVVQETERARIQAEEENKAMEEANEMACGGKMNKYPDGGQKNTGTWKTGTIADNWNAYTRNGLKDYLQNIITRINAAPDEETKNAIRTEAMNTVNGIQQAYAGAYQNNLTPNKELDTVRDLQTAFQNAGGNAYFNNIANNINLPYGANTLDRPGTWVDGYWGPRTSIRNWGSTEYGNADYYKDIADLAAQAGLNYAPNAEWVYGNGNQLYGLSMTDAAALQAAAKPGDPNYWQNTPEQAGWNEYSQPVTPEVAAAEARRKEAAVAAQETGEQGDSNSGNPKKNPWRGLSGLFGADEEGAYPTWMRWIAPGINAALVAGDTAGLTNNPDYTYASKIEAAANRAGYAPNVRSTYIGDYVKLNPLDILFYSNQLQANARATDRAIANSASPAKNAALLASGYNNQIALGNLYRQQEESNNAQRMQVADFNRKTNMFNSQMALDADTANARYRQQGIHAQLNGLAQAAALRDSIDQRVGAARSANLTNLLTSLTNIGRENFALNQINSDKSRVYGTRRNGVSYYKNKGACGGKMRK